MEVKTNEILHAMLISFINQAVPGIGDAVYSD